MYVYVYVDDHMKAVVQDVSVQLAELVGMVINTRQVGDLHVARCPNINQYTLLNCQVC